MCYLLGACDQFDKDVDPVYSQGEFPDIDVDYLPAIQDYLRNKFRLNVIPSLKQTNTNFLKGFQIYCKSLNSKIKPRGDLRLSDLITQK